MGRGGGAFIAPTAAFTVLPSLDDCIQSGWMDELMNDQHSPDMNLSKLQETVTNRGAWHAAVHVVTQSQIGLSNWTTPVPSGHENRNLSLSFFLLLPPRPMPMHIVGAQSVFSDWIHKYQRETSSRPALIFPGELWGAETNQIKLPTVLLKWNLPKTSWEMDLIRSVNRGVVGG